MRLTQLPAAVEPLVVVVALVLLLSTDNVVVKDGEYKFPTFQPSHQG